MWQQLCRVSDSKALKMTALVVVYVMQNNMHMQKEMKHIKREVISLAWRKGSDCAAVGGFEITAVKNLDRVKR